MSSLSAATQDRQENASAALGLGFRDLAGQSRMGKRFPRHSPERAVWPLLLRELEPFAARRAVIVPVKSRMRAQDLETAPNEKRQEKKVEEMRRLQPQWIIERHL